MATAQELSRDPEFLSLDDVSKRQVLESVDPEFTALDEDSKTFVLSSLKAPTSTLSPARQASVQQGANQESAARQAIIQEAQRGGLEKAISGVLGVGKALVSPVAGIAQGIGAIPELVADPSRIPATVAESARRTGIDIVQLGQMLGQAAQPKSATEAIFGPAGGIAGTIMRGIGNLRSFTPTEEAIQKELESRRLLGEGQIAFPEEVAAERQAVSFEGAEPSVAEALTQITELAPPIKGAQLLKAGGKGLAAVPRNIRSAIKPRNAQIGTRIEKAATEEIADIFHANPNADKLTEVPLEGFQQTVGSLRQQVGKEIGDLASQQQVPINAGDRISQRLLKEANDIEAAGGSIEDVAFLRQRASEMAGRAVDIDSTQRAVTNANQELTPFYQRSLAAQNPGRANVSNIANKIIAQEGGAAINGVLEAIGGPRGAGLRKKWSNLVTLEREAGERVNKILNNAPPEIQSVAQTALTSLEGAAGLVGLVNGYISGVIPLITSASKSWARKAAKELKNSNAIISKTYDSLRKTPPPKAVVESPPIPQDINIQIQRLLDEAGVGQSTPQRQTP